MKAGAAAAHGYQLLLLYAPNTSDVKAVMHNFARGVACPAEPSKKSVASQSFYALFRDEDPSSDCADEQDCMANPACWERLFTANLIGYATQVTDTPHSFLFCKT